MAPSDADARFDRTVDRWFRDQLAIAPETATFFGLHEHDGELPSGGRDAIDEELTFYRRDHRRAVGDRRRRADPRACARPRPGHPPGAARGSSGSPSTAPGPGPRRRRRRIGEALFPLFTRDFAPLAERLESIAARLERTPAYLAETRERVDRSGAAVGRDRHRDHRAAAGFIDTILAAARSESADAALVERLTAAADARKAALAEHAAWLRDDALPRATGDWKAGPERFEEMVRAARAGGGRRRDPGRRRGAAREREGGARRGAAPRSTRRRRRPRSADVVKDDHAATFAGGAGRVPRRRWTGRGRSSSSTTSPRRRRRTTSRSSRRRRSSATSSRSPRTTSRRSSTRLRSARTSSRRRAHRR